MSRFSPPYIDQTLAVGTDSKPSTVDFNPESRLCTSIPSNWKNVSLFWRTTHGIKVELTFPSVRRPIQGIFTKYSHFCILHQAYHLTAWKLKVKQPSQQLQVSKRNRKTFSPIWLSFKWHECYYDCTLCLLYITYRLPYREKNSHFISLMANSLNLNTAYYSVVGNPPLIVCMIEIQKSKFANI